MTQPVAGAHEDVGAGYGARERTAIRGLSHVSSGHATSQERIETLVVEAHEDIARLVAKRQPAAIQISNPNPHVAPNAIPKAPTINRAFQHPRQNRRQHQHQLAQPQSHAIPLSNQNNNAGSRPDGLHQISGFTERAEG
ncbi:MAG: hypothetical protein HYR56_28495 [Acidobacteria bacterium]|nr:hypothetical protein [Acidobacteriota bacterium]